jgi:hypothetical protein
MRGIASCFTAGTPVLTPGGPVPIESIRPGDTVLSTDPDTMERAPKPVVEAYVREASVLVHVSAGGCTLETTLDHPFWVQGEGFVEAGLLKQGDVLLDALGAPAPVESATHEQLATPVAVYNFQVADYHTYHVGEIGILVHNADDYVSSGRVPKDFESVLSDKSRFTRTNYDEHGARIYKGTDGNYYHRDTLHTGLGVELEVYNRRGQHIATADPMTGEIKPDTAKPGRRIRI